MLSRLLRTPEFLGRTYTAGLSALRLQQAIAEATEVHRHRYGSRRVAEPVLDQIDKLNVQITELRAERNKISHFCCLRSNDDEVFGTALAGGFPTPARVRRTERKLSMAELRRMHKHAFDLTETLMKVVESLPKVEE